MANRTAVGLLVAFGCTCGGKQSQVRGPDLEATPASFFVTAPAGERLGPSGGASGTASSTSPPSGSSGPVANGARGGASGSPGRWTEGCPAVAVTRGYGRLKVTLEGDVFFDFDKHALKPAALSALMLVKRDVIDGYPDASIIVEGHTDSVGSHSYNDGLSDRRAASVATWLERNGAGKRGISKRGYGKRHPRVPNDTPQNRAKNRRVEIVLIVDEAGKPPAPPSDCNGLLACCELEKAHPDLASNCKAGRVKDWGNDLARRSLTATGGTLSLTSCTTTRTAAIWITSTSEAKVAKLDERTGEELFRVPSYGKFPHRTALAEDGSVWITNRESRSFVHLAPDGKLLCSSPYDTCYTRAAAVDADGYPWIGCYNQAELIKVDPRATDGTTKVRVGRTTPELEVPKCKELARVKLDKVRPYGLVADRRGSLWVAINTGRRIAQVDARNNRVTRHVDLTDELDGKCWSPYGIAIDRDQNPWYANYKCGGVVKLDGRTGKLLGYFQPPPFEEKRTQKQSEEEAADDPSDKEEEKEVEYEPTPHLRAIGFDRRGHAWLPDNRGRHVYEFDLNGHFVKRVDLGACARRAGGPMGSLGTGSDSEGHMWTVLQSSGRVAEYNVDGQILGCYPDGKDTPYFRRPYTYSDFTGSSLSLGASYKGRITTRVALDHQVAWKMLAIRGATPNDTSLCVRARAGNESQLASRAFSELRCLQSKELGTMVLALDDLHLDRGTILELELELGSINPAVSPVIMDLSAAGVP